MKLFLLTIAQNAGLSMTDQITAGMLLEKLRKQLKEEFDILENTVKGSTIEVTVTAEKDAVTEESLTMLVKKIVGEKYFTFRVEVLEEAQKAVREQSSAKEAEPVKTETSGDITERIQSRIGNEEFKKTAAELQRIGERLTKIPGYFSKNKFLFSIDSGYGVSTVLRDFADLCVDLKLIFSSQVVEFPALTDTADPDQLEKQNNRLRGAFREFSSAGLICVDLSKCYDALKRIEYREMLRICYEDFKGLLIFRVPFLEEHLLQQIESDLSDLFYIHTVRFSTFSMDQLVNCAELFAEQQGFKLHKNMRNTIETMIAQEKSDGRFYGIKTMEKIVTQLIYEKLQKDLDGSSSDLSADYELSPEQEKRENSAEDRLRQLIGMDQIADKIIEIVTMIEYAKKNDTERPTLHMRFVGPPGTGKTTVARLLGEILKERGILRTGVFFEYSGNDFIAKYVGHTAAKTARMCRDAYGGVMFVDEAYSLAYNSENTTGSFREEAMNTLLEQMENHRDDMVVIMAGYETEMDVLMQSNPGLVNRLPYVIRFERYEKEQLSEIFFVQAQKRFSLTEDFKEHVRNYFKALPNNIYFSPTFSNARYVRNIYERVVSKAALRARYDGSDFRELKIEDFEKASMEIENAMTASMMYGKDDSGATMFSEEDSSIRFKDVCGEDEAKELLAEMIDFVKNPAKYRKIGAVPPKGALLCGPPGTGKTMLVRAAAGEAGIPVLTISGSDLVSRYVGEGTEKVRKLFSQARKLAPCIVFIDEIDAIGSARGRGGDSTTLIQLLTEMDGFNGRQDIMMLAATNQPEILDPALKRPGRFDREIPVELPALEGRMEILLHYLENTEKEQNIDLKEVANLAAGMSGADLKNVVNEAALKAIREGRDKISQSDLEESIEIVMVGHKKKGSILSAKEKWIVCYHEIGHALAAALQSSSAPVKKITVLPRTGGTLGYAMQNDPEERYLYTKTELENRIVTIAAGRAAEEVHFGEVTTGASNDIEKATRIARNIVMRYGMSEQFDMTCMETGSGGYPGGSSLMQCSDLTAEKADQAVIDIVRKQHQKAVELLRANEAKLDELAAYIYEKETITGEQFMEILKKEN